MSGVPLTWAGPMGSVISEVRTLVVAARAAEDTMARVLGYDQGTHTRIWDQSPAKRWGP